MKAVYLSISLFLSHVHGAAWQPQRREALVPRATTTCPIPTTTSTKTVTSTVKTTTTIKSTTTTTSTRTVNSTSVIRSTSTISTTKTITSTKVVTSTKCPATSSTTITTTDSSFTTTNTSPTTSPTPCPSGKFCGSCGCSYQTGTGYVNSPDNSPPYPIDDSKQGATPEDCFKICDDNPNCAVVEALVSEPDVPVYCTLWDLNALPYIVYTNGGNTKMASRVEGQCTNNQCYGYTEGN